MDTVKVDVQKLQLLNDRIAQTIEALNLVRMSVHGIQHTTPQYGLPYGIQAQPWPVTQGYPFPAYATPYTTPYPTPYPTPFVPGIQHTSPFTSSTTPFGGGISHTSAFEPTWQTTPWQTTPWQMRTTTFPFVQYPYPVTIS